MMRQKYYLLLILTNMSLFSGCSFEGEDMHAYTSDVCDLVMRNDRADQLPYSWNMRFPISIQAHKSLPENHRHLLGQSVELWNESVDAKMFVANEDIDQSEDLDALEIKNDKKNVLYWLNSTQTLDLFPIEEDDDIDPRKALGITRHHAFKWGVFYYQAYDADIILVKDKIEDFALSFHQLETNQSFEVFLENMIANTLAHELGHVLGLEENPDSILMNPKTYPSDNLTRQTVDDVSLKALECIYDLDLVRANYPLEPEEETTIDLARRP